MIWIVIAAVVGCALGATFTLCVTLAILRPGVAEEAAEVLPRRASQIDASPGF